VVVAEAGRIRVGAEAWAGDLANPVAVAARRAGEVGQVAMEPSAEAERLEVAGCGAAEEPSAEVERPEVAGCGASEGQHRAVALEVAGCRATVEQPRAVAMALTTPVGMGPRPAMAGRTRVVKLRDRVGTGVRPAVESRLAGSGTRAVRPGRRAPLQRPAQAPPQRSGRRPSLQRPAWAPARSNAVHRWRRCRVSPARGSAGARRATMESTRRHQCTGRTAVSEAHR